MKKANYKIIQGNSLVEKIYDIDFSYQKQSNLAQGLNKQSKLIKQLSNSIKHNQKGAGPRPLGPMMGPWSGPGPWAPKLPFLIVFDQFCYLFSSVFIVA